MLLASPTYSTACVIGLYRSFVSGKSGTSIAGARDPIRWGHGD